MENGRRKETKKNAKLDTVQAEIERFKSRIKSWFTMKDKLI